MLKIVGELLISKRVMHRSSLTVTKRMRIAFTEQVFDFRQKQKGEIMPTTYVVLSLLLAASIPQNPPPSDEMLPDFGSNGCCCRSKCMPRLIMPAKCKADETCPLKDTSKGETVTQKDSHKRQKDVELDPSECKDIVQRPFLQRKYRRFQRQGSSSCRRPLRRFILRCRR